MLCICTVMASCHWRKGLSECIGLNQHLMNEITTMALKRANIETYSFRRDANEYHVSTALSASRAMDVEIDFVRQEIRFLHDASLLQEGGSGQQNIARRQPYFGAINWP
jgi:hypothetical protein